MTENLRGIVLMILAMAGFAVEDALIKHATTAMPAGQVLVALGGAGTVIFGLWARARGTALLAPFRASAALRGRTLAEMFSTLGFVTALSLIPLSTATAVLQAAPILVTAGAALLLGEQVGWRRWTAALVGFAGILLILRPGLAGFDPLVLWALFGTAALAARDLFTRRMPKGISTPVVATWGNFGVLLMGSAMLALSGGAAVPSLVQLWPLVAAVAIGTAGYWAVIEATRAGDVSAIAPFRYARLVFGLALGVLVFQEPLSWPMIAGSALVVASGLYILTRERRLALSRASV